MRTAFAVTLLFLAALCCCGALWAQTDAGNRPSDSNFLREVPFVENIPVVGKWASLEDRIIRLQQELSNLETDLGEKRKTLDSNYQGRVRELRGKQSEAKPGSRALPLLPKRKDDYRATIEEEHRDYTGKRERFDERENGARNNLENALATPPSDEIGGKRDEILPGTASREQWELYAAAVNLQTLVNDRIAQLMLDRSNYDLALDTYDLMAALIETVIRMNLRFQQNIDVAYVPEARDLLRRIERSRELTGKEEGLDEEFRQAELDKLDKIEAGIAESIPTMSTMKEWAVANIESLQPRIKELTVLRRNVGIARDARAFIDQVSTEFLDLEISLPPIVEYDLVESDFRLDIESTAASDAPLLLE